MFNPVILQFCQKGLAREFEVDKASEANNPLANHRRRESPLSCGIFSCLLEHCVALRPYDAHFSLLIDQHKHAHDTTDTGGLGGYRIDRHHTRPLPAAQ